jgi:hypothetical protein
MFSAQGEAVLDQGPDGLEPFDCRDGQPLLRVQRFEVLERRCDATYPVRQAGVAAVFCGRHDFYL